MKSKTLAVAVALSIAGAAGALAHGGATGIVKKRMDAMTAMSDVIKALTPIMRGQVAYDVGAVRNGAVKIRDHAKTITDLFPQGTSGHPSEARNEVWTEWSTFETLARRLETLAGGLEAAAGNPPVTGGRGFGMGTGQNMMGGKTMMGNDTMLGQGMMNGQAMGGGPMFGANMPLPDAGTLAAMPANGVFNMVAATCSACHAQFRKEDRE